MTRKAVDEILTKSSRRRDAERRKKADCKQANSEIESAGTTIQKMPKCVHFRGGRVGYNLGASMGQCKNISVQQQTII